MSDNFYEQIKKCIINTFEEDGVAIDVSPPRRINLQEFVTDCIRAYEPTYNPDHPVALSPEKITIINEFREIISDLHRKMREQVKRLIKSKEIYKRSAVKGKLREFGIHNVDELTDHYLQKHNWVLNDTLANVNIIGLDKIKTEQYKIKQLIDMSRNQLIQNHFKALHMELAEKYLLENNWNVEQALAQILKQMEQMLPASSRPVKGGGGGISKRNRKNQKKTKKKFKKNKSHKCKSQKCKFNKK